MKAYLYLVFSLVSAATLLTTTPALADSSGFFGSEITETRYSAWVANMPDLDQKRLLLLKQGQKYCGPAAAANILTFIANNGYPEVEPGWVPNAWNPFPEVPPLLSMKQSANASAYRDQTQLLRRIASEVDEFDPLVGSKVSSLSQAIKTFLPDSFHVSYIGQARCGSLSTEAVEPGHIFWNLALGYPTIIHFSRFQIEENGQYTKTGGHYVTPVLLTGDLENDSILIGYRDSSAEDTDLMTQSTYRTEIRWLKRVLVTHNDLEKETTCRRWRWTMHTTPEMNDSNPQILEWAITVYPDSSFPGASSLPVVTP